MRTRVNEYVLETEDVTRDFTMNLKDYPRGLGGVNKCRLRDNNSDRVRSLSLDSFGVLPWVLPLRFLWSPGDRSS